MKKYDRLIFIDEDDPARPPMAAAIMQKKHLLSPLTICSRGLVVLFPEPVNQKAEAILVSHGLTARDHAAVQLTEEDLEGRRRRSGRSGMMRGMFIQLRNMLGKEENWGLCTGSRWFPMENVMKRWMR